MECKADHSPKKGLKVPSITKFLNNYLTIVSCVYEPLLQSGVLSLHSSQS